MKKRILCLLLSLALMLSALPALTLAETDSAKLSLDSESIGNTGARITASAEGREASILSAESSNQNIAVCRVIGNAVEVSGVPGAAGVARITVTAKYGGRTLIEIMDVPVGYTTFRLSGYSVTVIEGSDNNYEVVGLNMGDEIEYPLAVTTDEDGNTVYTGSADSVPFISIKKNGGVYVFEGSSANAGIIVKKEAKNDAFLLLNGIELANEFTSAITVKKDSRASVVITALAGTVNTLADSALNNADVYGPIDEGGDGSNQYYAESAVIKAKTSATVYINGEGTLNISANAKNGIKCGDSSLLEISELNLNVNSIYNGISSDSEIDIRSGNINVTAAGNDAIKAENDASDTGVILVTGGNIIINSADEGIFAADKLIAYGGEFDINCGGDALKAENADESDGDIHIYGGEFTIITDCDGFQTAGELNIHGGSFDITCCGGIANTAYNKDVDPSAKGMKSGNGDLIINGGNIIINSADDAIHTNSSLYIHGGSFTLASGDDGVHADYVMFLGDADGDDSAIELTVTDSYEGIEAANIYILSGNYEVYCSDDCINAANRELSGYGFLIRMYGGHVVCHGRTGDGVDSNNEFSVAGGTLEVYAPGNGNSALDCDGAMNLVGGTTIGVGSGDMVQAPNSGIYVQFSGVSFASGDAIAIYNSSNTAIFEGTVEFYGAARNANHVTFASSLLTSGQTYYLYKNGSRLSSAASRGSSGSIGNPPEPGDGSGSSGWTPVGETSGLYARVTSLITGIPAIITNTGNTYALTGGSSISASSVSVTASGSSYAITGVSGANTWYSDASGHIYCSIDGSNYYLKCNSSGSGWNPTYTLTTTTDSGAASIWTVSASGSYARIYTTVSSGMPGGPGGGPGGGRTLYLYSSGSSFSVSTSAGNLYIYSPDTAMASLSGRTSHLINIDNGEAITEAEVLAQAEVHYKPGIGAEEQTLPWDSSLVSYEWNAPLTMAQGNYIMSVSVSGTEIGSVSVTVVSPSGGGTAPIPPIPEPVTPTPEPATPTPEPATPTPAPATPTPEPATPTPEPATPTPEPATPTPEPATPTPEPATPTPEPATPTPEPVTPTPVLMGDINGDGEVNLQDAALLGRYVLALIGDSGLILEAGDMNGDGSLDNSDTLLLLRAALSL